MKTGCSTATASTKFRQNKGSQQQKKKREHEQPKKRCHVLASVGAQTGHTGDCQENKKKKPQRRRSRRMRE